MEKIIKAMEKVVTWRNAYFGDTATLWFWVEELENQSANVPETIKADFSTFLYAIRQYRKFSVNSGYADRMEKLKALNCYENCMLRILDKVRT